MSGSRKDFFGLRYPNHEPVYLDRFGVEFQISGMWVTGKDNVQILIVTPSVPFIRNEYQVVTPTLDEWIEILKQTDDPEYYETSPDGKIVKAIHRKCQRQIAQQVQWNVYRKAGFKCGYCLNERPLTMDHKIPVELGGTDEESNLEAACHPCNKDKANMPWEQWLEVMKKRGYKNQYTQ
jgi:hypothetical protein